MVAEKVLRSLDPKFDFIFEAIEQVRNLTKLTINQLMGSLLVHEERTNRSNGNSIEQIIQSRVDLKRESNSNFVKKVFKKEYEKTNFQEKE